MKAWVTKFTGEYFETTDNVIYFPSVAKEVDLLPSKTADDEIKIQKEIDRFLRTEGGKAIP